MNSKIQKDIPYQLILSHYRHLAASIFGLTLNPSYTEKMSPANFPHHKFDVTNQDFFFGKWEAASSGVHAGWFPPSKYICWGTRLHLLFFPSVAFYRHPLSSPCHATSDHVLIGRDFDLSEHIFFNLTCCAKGQEM